MTDNLSQRPETITRQSVKENEVKYAIVDRNGKVVALFDTADAAIAAKYKRLFWRTYRVVQVPAGYRA